MGSSSISSSSSSSRTIEVVEVTCDTYISVSKPQEPLQ